jgi:hypothetical protein
MGSTSPHSLHSTTASEVMDHADILARLPPFETLGPGDLESLELHTLEAEARARQCET